MTEQPQPETPTISTGRWWVSWHHDASHGPFEYHGPWWVSGYDADGRDIICAAVVAADADAAQEVIRQAYDTPPGALDWRFADELTVPLFSDRFQRANWMHWPDENEEV